MNIELVYIATAKHLVAGIAVDMRKAGLAMNIFRILLICTGLFNLWFSFVFKQLKFTW